jgi:3-isopropylmalate dehydratase small subunit
MKAVRLIRSRTVVLPVENVDTDRIIPARFLVTTSREEPQPKLRPATRTRAVSGFSHRQSAKSPFPRPSREVVTRNRAGTI